MSFIARFLIDRPLLSRLLILFVVALAIASASKMRRLGYPRVDMERLTVMTNYPGASPEDVELNVTIKLEDALKEVEGIEKFESRSVEGQSRLRVFIDPDADDKERVKREIQRAIDRVSDLPAELEEDPFVFENRADNWPTYEVAMVYEGKEPNEWELYRHAKQLKRRLLDLRSVSRVGETGLYKKEIHILLDRQKMIRNQVAFDEVINAIRENKLRQSGGVLESFTTEKNIITLSEFEDPKTLENLIIRSNALGRSIRIKDVGKVQEGFEQRAFIVRYNGHRGVSLWVFKKSSADVINTVRDIKDVIESYKKNVAPAEMAFLSTYDASEDTRDRLDIVYGNAVIGFLLVLFVLFFFLDRRVALWTALGIPVSLAIAFIVIPQFGITINSISLCGIIVVLGMVVDDAIIVAESIYRFREKGESPLSSAMKGLGLVIKPVFGMIVTTMIAFSPIYFVPGVIGKFSLEIPTIVILILAASFIEATIMLPAHLCHSMERSRGRGKSLHRLPRGQKIMTFLEIRYTQLLSFVLRRKKVSGAIIFLLIVSGILVSAKVSRFELFLRDRSHRIWVSGKLPTGAALTYTSEKTKIFENLLKQLPEGVIHSYRVENGRNFDGWTRCASCFTVKLALTPATKREMTAQEVKDFLNQGLAKLNPNPFEKIDFNIDSGGPSVGKPIEIRIIGNDSPRRVQLVEQVMASLKDAPLTELKSDIQEGKEEVRLIPRYEEVAASQVTVRQVASAIRTSVDGTIVSYMHTPEERIPFRVLMDKKDLDLDHPTRDIYVRTRSGGLTPVDRLVEKAVSRTSLSIKHYNSDRYNIITANVDPTRSDPKKMYGVLKEKFADFEKKNPGFKVLLSGEAQKSADTYSRMGIYIGLAVFTIFLLLTVQFNSFTQPLMVILAVPFGLAGVGVAFGLSGMPLSLMAMIGVLGMTGVVVNDSLIMVDFINRLSRKGAIEETGVAAEEKAITREELSQAVIEGARYRFRPILLTTLTTLAGLIPTAYGLIGGFDSFVSPMVLAMMWGLLFGTTSILIVIPYFYSVHWELMAFFKRKFRREEAQAA